MCLKYGKSKQFNQSKGAWNTCVVSVIYIISLFREFVVLVKGKGVMYFFRQNLGKNKQKTLSETQYVD